MGAGDPPGDHSQAAIGLAFIAQFPVRDDLNLVDPSLPLSEESGALFDACRPWRRQRNIGITSRPAHERLEAQLRLPAQSSEAQQAQSISAGRRPAHYLAVWG